MRTSWWAGLLAVVLTCTVAYRLFDRPAPPVLAPSAVIAPPGEAAPPPVAQEQPLPPIATDDGQRREQPVQDIAPAVAAAEPAPAAPAPALAPAALKPVQPSAAPEAPEAPAASESARAPGPQQDARLEEAAVPIKIEPAPAAAVEPAAPADAKRDLSYLHYYAYSELPPATKPADTVLNSLKGVPPGTPIEEIKRVSDLLGLDFTFMKTVAKIESGFDPKQRTGSYIGLFQLSRKEFAMYGSGDILDARDNTVAAALKFMMENVMFEMFTRRTPTFDDVYLIHQQGVEGAVEHLGQPRRLAWRSMCATYEGKEKGEKWCKRAIWGNTLPAVKRVWKSVDKVTSADFVGMWRQRVAEFYAQYSKSAAK